MEEIRNKVAESGLINLDLTDFKPDATNILEIDIATQLWQGLVLKEKDFRAYIQSNDWSVYQDKFVYIHCSADAIVPTWAYMLVASRLQDVAALYVVGSKMDLERELIKSAIAKLDVSPFLGGRLIIKGCADITCPEFAMTELIKRVQPTAKSIMYGEPCSTVPIYKAK